VFVSPLFRWGLLMLDIRHQRTEPGCPWQNGRVERFIGTVKRALALELIADGDDMTDRLRDVRAWYNHARPHDHLQGRTPAEVWAGIDIFAPRFRTGMAYTSRTGDRSQADKASLRKKQTRKLNVCADRGQVCSKRGGHRKTGGRTRRNWIK
jgi:hypothetical protein